VEKGGKRFLNENRSVRQKKSFSRLQEIEKWRR